MENKMGIIIDKFAFKNKNCTYNKSLPYLKFIKRTSTELSTVKTYYIPIRHYHIDDSLPTLFICHGNAEDIGECEPEELSKKFNANIFIYDYAGYGLHSCRTPSESNAQEDTIEVYKYLIKKVNPQNIIIYGRSLGTALACFLAYNSKYYNKRTPQKLILISPLYSAISCITDYWSPIDKFMNYILAPHIKCHTLILHGMDDTIVPYKSGYDLAKKFKHLYKFHPLIYNDTRILQ